MTDADAGHEGQEGHDDGYEDVEDNVAVELDDISLNMVAQVELDQEQAAYLAQADLPPTVEDVDWSIADWDDGSGDGSAVA